MSDGPRYWRVSSDGTPEGDRAARIAERLLESVPEDVQRDMLRAAAKWAAHPMLYGVPHPDSLESVLRRRL